VATIFVVGTPWVKVGRSILLPPLWLNKDYVLAAVAVVATTVSPYLFLAGGADGITGIDVITRDDALVHVTGHPRREELTRLYSWVKPTVLVPVHGEPVHLEAHARLGRESGIPDVIEARNGDLVRLFPEPLAFPGEVRTGELYLDGTILCTPDESGVKGRRRLSFGGHIGVSLCVSANGGIVAGPEIAVDGLPEVEDDDESLEQVIRRTILGTLKSIPPKRRADPDLVNAALVRAVRGEVNAFWGKKPNVTVFVHRV